MSEALVPVPACSLFRIDKKVPTAKECQAVQETGLVGDGFDVLDDLLLRTMGGC